MKSSNANGNNDLAQPFFGKRSAYDSPGKNAPFFQAKLAIGTVNDPFEQEADMMADRTIQQINGKNNHSNDLNHRQSTVNTKQTSTNSFLQTKCAACEQEEKVQKEESSDEIDPRKIQKKPIFESNAEKGNEEEMIHRKCAECEKEEQLNKKEMSTPQPVQLMCDHCAKEEEQKVQAKSGGNQSLSPSSGLESRLMSSKGSGSDLPSDTREQMESSFGADFSGVKIHTDSTAAEMNKDLNAKAFTHGSDIYFNAGNYDTTSTSGKHLLAHELTHTVQQGNSNSVSPAPFNYSQQPAKNIATSKDKEVIRRSPSFTSTIEICRRLLESRKFQVTDGSVMVRIDPKLSNPEGDGCAHHNFSVNLVQAVDWGFDIEMPALEFNSSGPNVGGWINVPNGEYYLRIWRTYDNPTCCLTGDIDVSEGTSAAGLFDICDNMRKKKEFPSQNGGDWDWAGTGLNGRYGPGPKLDGPLDVYERNPGIASGSLCRGACGPNCDTCTPTPEYIYTDAYTGVTWKYTNWEECSMHEGCRQHDAAFDWAAAVHGEVGKGAELMKWHMRANTECVCNYSLKQCGGWIIGRPPYDGKIHFADKVERVDHFALNDCKEQNPSFTNCTDEGADMDEVLVLWGLENGYSNFRDCGPYQDFPEGIINACDLGPGRTWHCKATDDDTGKDVIVSIFECYCCEETGSSSSDFRSPHLSGANDMKTMSPPSTEVPLIRQDTYDAAKQQIFDKEFGLALDVVMLDLIGSKKMNPALFTIKFEDLTDSGEGLTSTDYVKDPGSGMYVPHGKSRMTIYTLGFSSVQLLVSVIMHEYQHVIQHQQPRKPEEFVPISKGGKKEEYTEAHEIEGYLWEIENVTDTGLINQPGAMKEIFERLTDHYNKLGLLNPTRQETYRLRYEAAKKMIPPPTKEEEDLEKCDDGDLPQAYCDKLYKKVRQRFGNKERKEGFDPDKDIDKGRRRIDDAPLIDSFRIIYNRLDSWDVYIRRLHPDWYDEFTAKFSLNKKRNDWLAYLKERTATYKSQFRDVSSHDVEKAKKEFEKDVKTKIETEIDALNREIAAWYKAKSGTADDINTIIEKVHVKGTELWREEWLDAILSVNRILSSLWPPAKAKIITWVDDQRKLYPGEDLSGDVKDLDYVGSLATGYKGAPKQFIRFNVNKFDVDGNVDAPPLAKFAMKIDGIKPDRQRIFTLGQGTSITPLIDFCYDAHRGLSKVPGYEVREQFDVVIKAPETPEQRRSRKGTDRIYKLRDKLGEPRYNSMIDELRTAGLLEEEDGGWRLKSEMTADEEKKFNSIISKYES